MACDSLRRPTKPILAKILSYRYNAVSVQFHVNSKLHVVRASYHIMTSYRVSITEKTTEKCYPFVKCNGFL